MHDDDKKTRQGIAVVAAPTEALESTESVLGHPPQSGQQSFVSEQFGGHNVAAVQAPMQPVQAPMQPAVDGVPSVVDGQYSSAPVQNAATSDIETLSGRFIWISLWRAFRLQIHASEVLASERRILEEDAQHIVDPEHQAFLAWRRSVLLVVAICFVPLTLVRLVEAFQGPPMPVYARMFVLFPAIAEGLFCAIAFDQLRNWTRWKKQRKVLFIAWAVYMLAPFIVYLYPFRTIYEDSLIRTARQAAEIGGMRLALKRDTLELVVGLAFGVKALLVLGPKVISLMPGLIRAAIVSKLLFPGMTAPGWLMMLAAPLYALFAYIILLLPYQITGSWLFVAGNASLLIAQVFITLAGRRLIEPLSLEEARHRIQRSWKAYSAIMMVSAGFMVFGLHDFVSQMHLSNLRIVSSILAFISGVLLLTLIGTDGIVGGMAHFRKAAIPNPEREKLLRNSEDKLNRFSD
ncbi:MAG: hypothetical protein JKY56_17920 [Kofleriaceae bacterium]|nr:hypothetical protein [Kofleriaceae bacterium]